MLLSPAAKLVKMRTRQIAYCATVATALVVAPHRTRPLTRRPATPIPPPTPSGARVVIKRLRVANQGVVRRDLSDSELGSTDAVQRGKIGGLVALASRALR